MKNKKIEKYLLAHPEEKPFTLAKRFKLTERTIREYRKELGLKPHKANRSLDEEKPLTDEQVAELAKQNLREEKESRDNTKAIRHFVKENERLQSVIDSLKCAKASRDTLTLNTPKSGEDDCTAVVLASDWHIEEPVHFGAVNGLNSFNLEIAEKRVATFWQSVARLVKAKQKSVKIDTLIVGLLGDFFSGWIHDELMVGNLLGPSPAMVKAHNWIRDGLKSLIDQKLVKKIVCVCHSGNHARITKKIMVSEENAASLEFAMYHLLASELPEIEWVIPDGYHSYTDVHGFVLRMHHGHAIRFMGGIGGLFIPALKAVGQWNKARKADIDLFGHHHQWKFGGSFLCNSSLIGYSPFSVWIKSDYERPSQSFFLINHKRKQITDICPVYLD